jgi:uncharacterized hydrophobic protein (TIGR00271 family)
VTNNPVLIVGAMIVSPDYGPMAALTVAVVNRTFGRAWKSFRALAIGFPMAALVALLITLAARGLGRLPAAYVAGERPLTGLLIGPNLGAFVVAFVAGAAGIIALGRAKSGAVVGVLVSITTIPAAANSRFRPVGVMRRPLGPPLLEAARRGPADAATNDEPAEPAATAVVVQSTRRRPSWPNQR